MSTQPTAGAMRAAKFIKGIIIGADGGLMLTEELAQIIDRESGLAQCVEALQDALVCLDGQRYNGEKIYDEEPYAKQKQALAKATKGVS